MNPPVADAAVGLVLAADRVQQYALAPFYPQVRSLAQDLLAKIPRRLNHADPGGYLRPGRQVGGACRDPSLVRHRWRAHTRLAGGDHSGGAVWVLRRRM